MLGTARESNRGSKNSARGVSARGVSAKGTMRNSASRSQINDGKDTVSHSAVEKTFNKEGEEICKHVNMQTFKSIYGHGLGHKFVKLLFVLLKKQIDKFVEHKNSTAKNNQAA